jgi:hypothetical protein
MWEDRPDPTSDIGNVGSVDKAGSYAQPIHIWRGREKATSINGIKAVDVGYQHVHTAYYYYELYLLISGSTYNCGFARLR